MTLARGRLTVPLQPTGGTRVTRFATRGDHRLSYESSGAAHGIPVLALHDLLADRGQLRALGEPPHDAMIRVTLPDARGHGASPMLSGRGYPTRELAADALAVLDAEGLERVHLAAIGWGAATALTLAAPAPERIASLVLAAPYLPALLAESPDAAPRQIGLDHLEIVREAANAAEKGQIDRALDLFLSARIGADWRGRFSKPRLGAIRRAAGNLAPLLAGMANEPVDRDALKNLDAPVTLLIRDDAQLLERGTVDALASHLPRARIETISPDNERHSDPGAEWTEAVARALLAAGG